MSSFSLVSGVATRFLQNRFLNAITWDHLFSIWPPFTPVEKPSVLFLFMRVPVTDVVVTNITPVSEKWYCEVEGQLIGHYLQVKGLLLMWTFIWWTCSLCLSWKPFSQSGHWNLLSESFVWASWICLFICFTYFPQILHKDGRCTFLMCSRTLCEFL